MVSMTTSAFLHSVVKRICAEQWIVSAIEMPHPGGQGCSASCSVTIRTARAKTVDLLHTVLRKKRLGGYWPLQ
ncbi:hypothetical protein ELI43_02105 [Rhizobium leguminosarum]|uniref:hypothetical protein n=1 Tax=Rhizobium leguminosarum TaxID=384 RepID=UPI00102FCCF0|nr:hypothetical protein [Rhizobium leguminosarum]TAU51700.1 hypothetical protein ELI43_02105 [Rhizobium leguminosarum]